MEKMKIMEYMNIKNCFFALILSILCINTAFANNKVTTPDIGNLTEGKIADANKELVDNQTDPTKEGNEAQKFTKYLDGAAKISESRQASGSGFTYPDGFFDGPAEHDMAYKGLIFLFGSPVVKVKELFFGQLSQAELDDKNMHLTLAAQLAQIFNSIGVLSIMVISTLSLVSFTFKRAIEVGYLQQGKPPDNLFTLARGSYSFLFSLPIPAFGGLSTFQVGTIAAILFGLGMASAVIKVAAHAFIKPGIVVHNYPAINKFTSNILDAGICMQTKIKSGRFKKNSNGDTYKSGAPDDHYIIENSMLLDSINRTSGARNVGVEYKTTIKFGEGAVCGSIVLGSTILNYQLPAQSGGFRSDTNKANEIVNSLKQNGNLNVYWGDDTASSMIKKFTSIAITKAALESAKLSYVKLNPVAVALTDKEFAKKMGQNKTTLALHLNTYNQALKDAGDKVLGTIKEQLDHLYSADGIDENGQMVTINDTVDQIANLGFLGLASTYNVLDKQQESFNEAIQESFQDMKSTNWSSSELDIDTWYESFGQWLISYWSDDETEAFQVSAKNRQVFLTTYKKEFKSTSQVFENINDNLTQDSTITRFFGWVMQSASKLALGSIQQLSDTRVQGAYFPDPIQDFRTLGNAITGIVAGVALHGYVQSLIGEEQDSLNKGDGGGDSKGMSPLVSMLVMGLLVVGFFYSNILPALPYIMWSAASLAMVAYYLEAIWGAGWWGAGITQGTGDNLTGKAGEGINVILTLMLKPSLMCASFFAAMLLNRLLGFYVDATIGPAMLDMSEGNINVFSFIGTIAVTSIVATSGIYKNLSLIFELPPLMLNWISVKGVHNDNSHKDAQQTATSMSDSFAGKIKDTVSSAKPIG